MEWTRPSRREGWGNMQTSLGLSMPGTVSLHLTGTWETSNDQDFQREGDSRWP